MSRSRALLPFALLLQLLLLAGCASEPSPEELILEFTRAIQERDSESLFCLSAGAAGGESLGSGPQERRSGFAAWLLAEQLAYEEARDEGEIELNGRGVRLARLFALGRGAYYQEVSRGAVGTDGLRLRTRVKFGYAQIDLSRLSPGTTFYLAAAPPGRVLPIVVPAFSREIRVEVLDSILVEWTLLRAEALDGCAAGYKIVSVEPVDHSWSTRSIAWSF